jgi:hypothetical protein
MQMSVSTERVRIGHELPFRADQKPKIIQRGSRSPHKTQQATQGRSSTDADKTAPDELSRTLS